MPSSRPDPAEAPAATPLTRAQRQQETREALITAARRVFARDGFHHAGLEAIAKTAGFSKGAVYSNFGGKADLFLAVMDRDLALLDGDWDPFVRVPTEADDGPSWDDPVGAAFDDLPYDPEEGFGFALATLEFFATAVRDENLGGALRERIGVLVTAYGRHVARERSPDDPIEDVQLASMLTAYDQGMALMVVGGWKHLDTAALRLGLRRLLHPRPDEGA